MKYSTNIWCNYALLHTAKATEIGTGEDDISKAPRGQGTDFPLQDGDTVDGDQGLGDIWEKLGDAGAPSSGHDDGFHSYLFITFCI